LRSSVVVRGLFVLKKAKNQQTNHKATLSNNMHEYTHHILDLVHFRRLHHQKVMH